MKSKVICRVRRTEKNSPANRNARLLQFVIFMFIFLFSTLLEMYLKSFSHFSPAYKIHLKNVLNTYAMYFLSAKSNIQMILATRVTVFRYHVLHSIVFNNRIITVNFFKLMIRLFYVCPFPICNNRINLMDAIWQHFEWGAIHQHEIVSRIFHKLGKFLGKHKIIIFLYKNNRISQRQKRILPVSSHFSS